MFTAWNTRSQITFQKTGQRDREKSVCVCVCMHVSRFRESQEKGDFVRKEKINKWREWQVMVK